MSAHTELQLNAAGSFILGLSADVVAVLATQPLDVVKSYKQSGKFEELKALFRNTKGIPPVGKLWHGSVANCAGAVPQGGLPFLINALTARYLFKSDSLSDSQLVTNGMMTGLITACFVAPLDRVGKEQQFHGGSTLQASQRTLRQHGMRGLFKAIPPIAARDAIVFGTFFGGRKVVESRLQEYIPQDALRETVASATTGAFAGGLSNAFDRANTLMQEDKAGAYPTLRRTLQTVVQKEGVKGLATKGGGIRSLFMGAYYIALGGASERIKPHLTTVFGT